MKFLKKQGKKISVILLAIALMITPMLPLVKAATECVIKEHYYFIEGEVAWIDSTYKAKSDESIEVGTNWQDGSGDKDESNTIAINRRNYSGQYAVHFGVTTDTYSMNDTSIFPASSPYIKVGGRAYGNAVTVSLGPTGYDHTEKKTYEKNTRATMVSEAEFYNFQIPDGYSRSKVEALPWNDEDWNIFFQMYVDGKKVSDESELSAKDLVHSDDDDYYFVHFGWRNTEADDEDYYSASAKGDLDLKNSDTDNTFASMINAWASNSEISKSIKDSKVAQDEIAKIKAASIDVPSQIGIQNSNELGNTDLNGIVTLTITRSYGDLGSPEDINFWKTEANKSIIDRNKVEGGTEGLGNSNIDINDTWYWYFFPKKYDITFTAPAEVCKTGNPSTTPGDNGDENEGPDSPVTGVVSYAIIGTLLVGAASAYIYARKNNKFNKL